MKMKLSEYIEKFGDSQVDVDKLSEFIIEDKFWLPKENEKYYFVHHFGGVDYYHNGDSKEDINIMNFQQVYRTKEEAEFARDKAVFLEFMRKEFLRNSDVIDWKDDKQDKYEIYYSHAHKLIAFSTANFLQREGLFTTDDQWLRCFIGEHEDDIKKYYFEIKGEN